MQPKRMEMCAALWAQGVKAEFGYKAAPTIKDALGYADDNGIPFVVLFGESELASASVKVMMLCATVNPHIDCGCVSCTHQHLLLTSCQQHQLTETKCAVSDC